MNELIDILLPWLAPVLTGAVGYFGGKRKNRAEANALELSNVESAINIYRLATTDLQNDIKALKEELDVLHEQNERLFKENRELKLQLQDLNFKLNKMQS